MADSARTYIPDQSSVPHAWFRKAEEFDIQIVDLLAPPSRFWSDGAPAPRPVFHACEVRGARQLAGPAERLAGASLEEVAGRAATGRALARLRAWFLVCEDPQRRLEVRDVVTLAHQASLVQHVLQEPSLARVLIADEVGLGKTIEAGLILQELLRRQVGLRVLYLAPARLVANVNREFRRLGLDFRCFVSGQENTAQLTDARVIASIHRASHPNHLQRFVDGPEWDVLVVDECHHLSDWAKGGGSPVQKHKLVQKLVEKIRPGGRLMLMSGTPHQGHPVRFENLLSLLLAPGEDKSAIAGRVIYRTKDDVRDWDGRPLFPGRQVNRPTIIDLGPEHRGWLSRILDFFQPGSAGAESGRRRAAGWRAGQALQWATSSVEAGLGYLVRQGIRLGWDLASPGLEEAVSALRPYRGGTPDEPVRRLFERISREVVRQTDDADIEDIEEPEEGLRSNPWQPDEALLSELLLDGVRLLEETAVEKWDALWDRILADTQGEKCVLFAQPIETVTSLMAFLERKTGRKPAVILGGQTDEERQKEIDSFWDPAGPVFLVSSRAGGEGLNLQIARRLVHVDVPWNPMELEQRVGRVHRFLTRRTVLVDTLVVKESREADAYRVAREKLHEVARALVPAEKFEALFSRVMALVPPDDLQEILVGSAHGPLDDAERDRLSGLVTQGFQRWQDFDRRFADRQRSIRDLNPGLAGWEDVRGMAMSLAGATPVEGFSALRFRREGDEIAEESRAAQVLEIGGKVFAVGDFGGMPVTGPEGQKARSLGLNTPDVARLLREAGLSIEPSGVGVVRLQAGASLATAVPAPPFGVLCFARQGVVLSHGGAEEGRAQLRLYVVQPERDPVELKGEEKGQLVRALLASRPVLKPGALGDLISALAAAEEALSALLRIPTEEERVDRVRTGIFPVAAILVSP